MLLYSPANGKVCIVADIAQSMEGGVAEELLKQHAPWFVPWSIEIKVHALMKLGVSNGPIFCTIPALQRRINFIQNNLSQNKAL